MGRVRFGCHIALVRGRVSKELKHDLNSRNHDMSRLIKLVRAPGSRVDQMLMVDI